MAMVRLVPLVGSLLALGSVHGSWARGRHEVGLGAGGGRYWFSGCTTPRHESTFGELQAWYRTQRGGFSFAVEGSLVGARERQTEEPTAGQSALLRSRRTGGLLALRAGYHFPYVGVEAGPALVRMRIGDEEYAPILPSLRLWAGVPHRAYAFAAMLADEARGQSRILSVGLGHASARARGALGIAGSQGNDGSAFGDLALPITPRFWVGTGLQFGNPDTWSAMGMLILTLDQD